jgi:hypothetical protein
MRRGQLFFCLYSAGGTIEVPATTAVKGLRFSGTAGRSTEAAPAPAVVVDAPATTQPAEAPQFVVRTDKTPIPSPATEATRNDSRLGAFFLVKIREKSIFY